VVPRGGLPENSNIKSLSCPTLASRSIEFQGVFSRLSHSFDDPNRRAPTDRNRPHGGALACSKITRAGPSNIMEGQDVVTQPDRFRRSHHVPDAEDRVPDDAEDRPPPALPSSNWPPACLVAHHVRDVGVAGSNPATPTNHNNGLAKSRSFAANQSANQSSRLGFRPSSPPRRERIADACLMVGMMMPVGALKRLNRHPGESCNLPFVFA
jgi:hypothetical protein